MSFVQASTVLAIAQSLEVGTVSEEAAKALAPDVEYRLRETVQVLVVENVPVCNKAYHCTQATYPLCRRLKSLCGMLSADH